jgi:hypothetical protein
VKQVKRRGLEDGYGRHHIKAMPQISSLLHAHCVVCAAPETCEAHIIPKAFAREIVDSNNHVLQLGETGSRKAKRQLGLADKNILCSGCDGIIGDADKYAIEFARRFLIPTGARDYSVVPLPELDCDKIRKFAVSVVWKASISTLPSFADIGLGPYELMAQSLIFDGKNIDEYAQLHVQINALHLPKGDASSFITYPIRVRNENGPYFIFVAGGFQFLVRFGNRPFVNGKNQIFSRMLAIRSDGSPMAVVYPFAESGEFEIVKMVRKADLDRARSTS